MSVLHLFVLRGTCLANHIHMYVCHDPFESTSSRVFHNNSEVSVTIQPPSLVKIHTYVYLRSVVYIHTYVCTYLQLVTWYCSV